MRSIIHAGSAIGLIATALILAAPADAQRRSPTPPELQAGEKAFKEECGACHMPFPPYMLPARSWEALMGNLTKHFNENAALDAATRKEITDYLVGMAGDGPRGGRGTALLGLAAGSTPLRITETPFWQREHRRLTPEYMARRNAKSKANCVACHPGAMTGNFDD